VFVSNMGKSHDYSKAATFGALRPVTSGNFPIFKTARLLEEIESALKDSTPDDYLLISGSSVIAALCAVVWVQMHPVIKILMLDKARDCYVERSVIRADIRKELSQLIEPPRRNK